MPVYATCRADSLQMQRALRAAAFVQQGSSFTADGVARMLFARAFNRPPQPPAPTPQG
ncbi:MAG: hypothetical protein V4864_00055 [Pseudomonadota bacterium]